MKRGLFILMLLLTASLASAVEIKLSKETYQPEETLQAEIYGNFLENIKVENIHFYRERNIPVEYDILNLPDRYLLYALLPYKEGNYTLKIEDINYEEESVITDKEIVKTFQIAKGNESYLSIDPGFVVAREDFYIQVEAKENQQITAEFLQDSQTVDLVGWKEKKIYFSISNLTNYTEAEIKILDYVIPVFIFPNKSEAAESPKFRFNPLEIDTTILKEQKHSFTVALINFGLENITDIRLTVDSSDLSLGATPDNIPLLEAKSTKFINISISSEEEGTFEGKVIAEASNYTTELELYIDVTENQSEIVINDNGSIGYVTEESCSDKGGQVCTSDEICSVESIPSTDGFCCLGTCEEKPGDSSWIYGIILIVLIIVGLIGFSIYMKKKQGKPVDSLKKREETFQRRMQPPPSTEISGSLTKI